MKNANPMPLCPLCGSNEFVELGEMSFVCRTGCRSSFTAVKGDRCPCGREYTDSSAACPCMEGRTVVKRNIGRSVCL